MIYVRDFTCGARCACAPRSVTDKHVVVNDVMSTVLTMLRSLRAAQPSLGLLVADPRPLMRCAGRMWLSPGDACRGSGDGRFNRVRNGAPRPPIPPRDLSWVLSRPRARRRGSKLECGLSRRRCPSVPLLGARSASNRRERRRSTRVLAADLAALDVDRLYGRPASLLPGAPHGGLRVAQSAAHNRILGLPKMAKKWPFLTPCGAKSRGSGGAPPTHLILLRNQRLRAEPAPAETRPVRGGAAGGLRGPPGGSATLPVCVWGCRPKCCGARTGLRLTSRARG